MVSRATEDRAASAAFIIRLEEIAATFRSRAAFAKAAGIAPSSLQSYFEGTEPNRMTLLALADAGGVSLEWLARGRGYKEPRAQVPDGYEGVSFYDVRKAGGYVYPLVSADVAEFIFLKLDWFRYPGIEPGRLFLIEVTDSRVPEISEGDFVVVDGSWGSSLSDPTAEIVKGIYLVSRRARLSIQRVLTTANGVIELSGSPGAKSVSRRIGEEGFFVHGRIIWISRSLASRIAKQAAREK